MTVPARVAVKPRSARPRDAATLVIIDRSGSAPRILMGRRRADLAFMPNKFVFPGGRVDARDGLAPSVDELPTLQLDKLMLAMLGRGSQRRARALAMAAVRETLEETGIVIGSFAVRLDGAQTFHPQLSGLDYFARAITPPGRSRRYDTRFFCADARAISAQGHACDDELSGLDWFTLEGVRALDLPSITRMIVDDVAVLLDRGPGLTSDSVPFYHQRFGTQRRDQLVAPTHCGSAMATP